MKKPTKKRKSSIRFFSEVNLHKWKFFTITSKSLVSKLKGLKRRKFIPSMKPIPNHYLFNMPIYVSMYICIHVCMYVCIDSKYLAHIERHESPFKCYYCLNHWVWFHGVLHGRQPHLNQFISFVFVSFPQFCPR